MFNSTHVSYTYEDFKNIYINTTSVQSNCWFDLIQFKLTSITSVQFAFCFIQLRTSSVRFNERNVKCFIIIIIISITLHLVRFWLIYFRLKQLHFWNPNYYFLKYKHVIKITQTQNKVRFGRINKSRTMAAIMLQQPYKEMLKPVEEILIDVCDFSTLLL